MSTSKSVVVGDIVVIAAGTRFVPAKVLYVSVDFKDVILLGVYGTPQETVAMPPNLPADFADLLYTSRVPIIKGRWPRVGHEELLASQRGLAYRIVGGSVYLEDRGIRSATDDDFKTLRPMSVYGSLAFERVVARIFE
jgi:hypothetical protein